MGMRLPGAADSDPRATKARSGTRWSAALTVVSTTCGRFAGAWSAASVAMRRATTAACGETRS